jgi:putative flippase GtrA
MPPADRLLQELVRVVRFGVVGLAGFFVDAAILMLMTRVIYTDPFTARAVSAPIAILFTFAGNRHWSFATPNKPSVGSSFASYVSTQGAGFICNLSIYCAVMLVIASPLAALIVASATAMFVNYVGARFWAFKATD